ncbi:MAG: hypothetical protein O2856_06900 [Planctomycetota bacterium]|nr:hypothetical protein [Planctomycetota bacterium]
MEDAATFPWECVPRFWKERFEAAAAGSAPKGVQSPQTLRVLDAIERCLHDEFTRLSNDRRTAKFQYALGSHDSSDFAHVMRLARPVPCKTEDAPGFWTDEAARSADHVGRLILLACHFAGALIQSPTGTPDTSSDHTGIVLLAESLSALGAWKDVLEVVEAQVRQCDSERRRRAVESQSVPWRLELQYLKLLISDVRNQTVRDRIAGHLGLSSQVGIASNNPTSQS